MSKRASRRASNGASSGRTLAGVLIQIRAQAHARPGEWCMRTLGRGLHLAWRTTEAETVDQFALRREGEMPSEQEMRTCIMYLDDALAPCARREHAERYTVVFAIEARSCEGCEWPLDLNAKMALHARCSVCQDPSRTRCKDCGTETSRMTASFIGFCPKCSSKRRAQMLNIGRTWGESPALPAAGAGDTTLHERSA